MPSSGRLAMVVCCAWALALLYGEMVAYWLPLWTCSWPHQKMGDEVKKVAVLADPQLMDRTSLRLPPGSFLLEVAQFYTDIYMRRSFHGSILPFKPDVVLFLGDLFDGGPFLSDQEWQKSLTRFRHIFGLNGLNEPGKVSGIPTYYLSGNHDIGYASIHSLHPEIITRFEKEFGARNYHFSIGKVEFIAIDAQTLDGPKKAQQTSLSWDFIKNISNDVTSYPRVLLTHIPLYRPNGTPCGPFRSSLVINQVVLAITEGLEAIVSKSRGLNPRAAVRPVEKLVAWPKPISPMLALNTDVAFDHANGKSGLGSVLIDSDGNVLAITTRTEGARSVLEAEAVAMYYVLIEFRPVFPMPYVLQTDSKLLHLFLNSDHTLPWYIQRCIEEIKSLLTLEDV